MNKSNSTSSERRRTLEGSNPPQSPTRTPPVPHNAESGPDRKKMHDEIIADYQAKHGALPDMEQVISEVFKRRGIKLPKRAFKSRCVRVGEATSALHYRHMATPAQSSQTAVEPPERFCTADDIAEHVKITRRQVMELARRGNIPGHSIGTGSRRVWRFKISEVEAAIAAGARKPLAPMSTHSTIPAGSPRGRKGRS